MVIIIDVNGSMDLFMNILISGYYLIYIIIADCMDLLCNNSISVRVLVKYVWLNY